MIMITQENIPYTADEVKAIAKTIEELRKKYDGALEKAKDMLSYKEVRQEDMEYLFPELAESEDERIRKEIISALKYANYKGVYNKHLAWLEKQGHMLDSDKVIEWLNDQACQGWIEDVEVDKFVDKFKKDFGL